MEQKTRNAFRQLQLLANFRIRNNARSKGPGHHWAFLFFILLFLVQAGCAGLWKSQPTVVGEIGTAEGQWRGKALVKNLKTGKSGTLDIDILAREPKQLRMELMSSFGVHVASVALNGNEVRYLLTQEKRFISSPANADALSKLIPIRLAPSALMAVLFDRELSTRDWICQKNNQGLVESCRHKSEPVDVRWIERNERKRRLKISALEANIEMVLDEARSKVEMGPEAFEISPPTGYKIEKISPSAL